ncbi:hypothetical protein ACI8B_290188 [Acinetobacter proteolyticus]|uniref:Transposase n=1 Tax=Acinetobacter proteolyticus TaxID=1776741 RepID=A0A653K7T6_9GAMM|nr:hypothetical protein ACI8B_290188 [Acinetobacter proteolyticus]
MAMYSYCLNRLTGQFKKLKKMFCHGRNVVTFLRITTRR